MSGSPAECAKCQAPAGRWVIRKRLDPFNPDEFICVGNDPGPDWWALVTRFYDVSDAPFQRYWHPPERVELAPPPGKPGAAPLCQFCRPADRAAQPTLFDEEAA